MKKKKFLSVLLCLCMVCTLLPVTAGALDGHTNHCVCAVKNCSEVGHDTGVEWTGTSTLPTTTGTYYLTTDVDLRTSIWEVPQGVTINLCLKGHKIYGATNAAQQLISVASGATLTITDCSADSDSGIHKEVVSNLGNNSFAIYTHGSLTLTGGVKLSATHPDGKPYTVYNDSSGSLTINGNAEISASNQNAESYGIYNNPSGTLILGGNAQLTAISTYNYGYGVAVGVR